jgi:hypothetical protein
MKSMAADVAPSRRTCDLEIKDTIENISRLAVLCIRFSKAERDQNVQTKSRQGNIRG